MAFEEFDDMPIEWAEHEDIAIKLYERFGDDCIIVMCGRKLIVGGT